MEVSAEELERVGRLVQTYDSLGETRTATPADHSCARWLVGELSRSGATAELERMAIDRIQVVSARVELPDAVIEGLPLYDAPPTHGAGVTGLLSAVGGSGAIGWRQVDPRDGGLAAIRRSTAHRALVVVAGDHDQPPGLVALNANHWPNRFGPPVLQVSSEVTDRLERASGREVATVVCETRRLPGQAFNVCATLEGSEPSLEPVVVLTPRSSWFASTAERAGGLVAWLDIARSLTVDRPRRTVHMVATTGHELAHVGLVAFLDQHPALTAAHCWVHLGAELTRTGDRFGYLQSSSDTLSVQLADAWRRVGIDPHAFHDRSQLPLGEAHLLAERGAAFVSALGGRGTPNWFHHRGDRWPTSVDVVRTARVSAAMVELTRRLAS